MTTQKKMTPEEIREAIDHLQDLIPYGDREAAKQMKAKFGWNGKKTRRQIERILKMWNRADAKEHEYDKSLAVRRIKSHITKAAARQNWAAVSALEGQLARVQGTEAPTTIKIDHTLGEAVAGVLQTLDVVQMAALVEEFDRLTAAAARAPALPEGPPVVDVELIEQST